MLYQWYEMSHAAMSPVRAAADQARLFFKNPFNPMSHTNFGRSAAAALEVFERTTRRYGKPEWMIETTEIDGHTIAVKPEVVWSKPFCNLIHFRLERPEAVPVPKTNLLLIAPLSGHYATLLRGTVEHMIKYHNVFITDWADARLVPMTAGDFELADYVDYMIELFALFEGDVHAMAVCQPSVPVLAAVSVLEAQNAPHVPRSMILLGGPLDTRINPTAVNKLAEEKGTDWFRNNVIQRVPWPHLGFGRKVYPGFLQLTGFMTMNLDRHMDAHKDLFWHLVQGDGDSAEKHRDFYDEYLSVLDLTAEFYLETVDAVFVRHKLPRGVMTHRNQIVDPTAIRRVALMTIEGEKDDITGVGQCRAGQDMCKSIPRAMKLHYEQPGVGHYGIFNGSRFRREIAPRITEFMKTHQARENITAPEFYPVSAAQGPAQVQAAAPLKLTHEANGHAGPNGTSQNGHGANGHNGHHDDSNGRIVRFLPLQGRSAASDGPAE